MVSGSNWFSWNAELTFCPSSTAAPFTSFCSSDKTSGASPKIASSSRNLLNYSENTGPQNCVTDTPTCAFKKLLYSTQEKLSGPVLSILQAASAPLHQCHFNLIYEMFVMAYLGLFDSRVPSWRVCAHQPKIKIQMHTRSVSRPITMHRS
jgi:hypothetical protein